MSKLPIYRAIPSIPDSIANVIADRLLLVIEAMDAEDKRRADEENEGDTLSGERWDGQE